MLSQDVVPRACPRKRLFPAVKVALRLGGRVHTAGRPRVSGARRRLQPLRAPREAEDSPPQFGLLCPAAEDFSMFLHQQLL